MVPVEPRQKTEVRKFSTTEDTEVASESLKKLHSKETDNHGKFHKGDSYIVLRTVETDSGAFAAFGESASLLYMCVYV